MKLSKISESFMSAKIREALVNDVDSPAGKMLNISVDKSDKSYDVISGHDSQTQINGGFEQSTGIPLKPRLRKYFGISVGPEQINI